MSSIFALTTFLASFLLFSVQPMAGKFLLPAAGGAPAAWNSCLLFFQLVLLAGYCSSYIVVKFSYRILTILLVILIAVAIAVYAPLVFDRASLMLLPFSFQPVLSTIQSLSFTVGLPALLLSSAAPLVQHMYFAGQKRSPYVLYAVSNTGSLLALLSYPIVIEPYMTLVQQTLWWNRLFVVFILLLTGLCIHTVCYSGIGQLQAERANKEDKLARPGALTFCFWILAAAFPASLLAGVTQFISTDIVSMPLFWVVPLALYLVTWIIAFSGIMRGIPLWLERGVYLCALVNCIGFSVEATQAIYILLLFHLIGFTLATLASHMLLASAKPDASYLTYFYLAVALGGLLGGAFNSLLAPLLFKSQVEYPLAFLAVLFLVASKYKFASDKGNLLQTLLPAMLFLTLYFSLGDSIPIQYRVLVFFAAPALICYQLTRLPINFAASLLLLCLASLAYTGVQGMTITRSRNFFGALRVTETVDKKFNNLIHGHIIHGIENRAVNDKCLPLAYYSKGGPVGNYFSNLHSKINPSRVALVGLGTGALTCYASTNESWDLYEINPAVIDLAKNSGHFSNLKLSSAGEKNEIIGDARLSMEKLDTKYDLIVLDAFSSDAIPAHLLTREAFVIYKSHLNPNGVILFHISNLFLDLKNLVALMGSEQGLKSFSFEDLNYPEEEASRTGVTASQWMLLTENAEVINVSQASRWLKVSPDAGQEPWTDDYSNIWEILRK